MRVFLGVDLRDAVGPAAEAWGRAVADALGPREARGLAWVNAARIHVTLRFFGTLDRQAVDGVLAALGDRVPVAPFDVALGRGGTFPLSGRPRVLWLGVAEGADALASLHAWVTPRVEAFGQPDRHAGFSPHVTIARVRREVGPGLGRALREAATGTPVPAANARVAALTVFESVSSGKGPAYLPIARVPLAGPPASG
jgi:2'-5' RNA ligase